MWIHVSLFIIVAILDVGIPFFRWNLTSIFIIIVDVRSFFLFIFFVRRGMSWYVARSDSNKVVRNPVTCLGVMCHAYINHTHNTRDCEQTRQLDALFKITHINGVQPCPSFGASVQANAYVARCKIGYPSRMTILSCYLSKVHFTLLLTFPIGT